MFLYLKHLKVIFSFTSYSRLGCWFEKPCPLSTSYLLSNSVCSEISLSVLDLKENRPIPFSIRRRGVWVRCFSMGKRETRAKKKNHCWPSRLFFLIWLKFKEHKAWRYYNQLATTAEMSRELQKYHPEIPLCKYCVHGN